MSYEQFVKEVEARLKKCVGEKREVHIHTATKNNGKKRQGITFVESGVNISPTIYLEEYYERFKKGGNIEQITEQIMELYQEVKFRHSWEGEFVQKYENIKDKIIYQLINRQANEELLKDIPHIPYLDLAIIFYVLIELDEAGERMATMLIRKEHLGWWKVEAQEVYRMARNNTKKLLPYEFSTMYAVVEELLGEGTDSGEAFSEEEMENQKDDMYVLSNMIRNYGAAAILYEDRLEGIALYLKENFYVLPSSVHEVIIVPESRAPSREDLCAIVSEINRTQVKEEEVLSDNAYYYDRTTGILSL